jgi:O-antigen ligase
METNSYVIKKISAFLAGLNYYFEYSLVFKGFLAVKKAAQGSRILNGFVSVQYRDYWQGSLILRFFMWILGIKARYISRLFSLISKANENSLNKKLFESLKLGKNQGFWAETLRTCAPVRFLRWLLCLKNAYMLFIVCALLVPSPMWNNMLLLLSAVFFAVVYAVKWFSDGGKALSFSHISPALLIFVFFCALSIFTGYGGGDSLRVFIIFFACVIHSVLVTLLFKEKEDFRLFFMLLAAMLTAAAIFGFYQYFAGIEIREELVDLGTSPGLSRLYSTTGNPNNDAMFWGMIIPFVLAVCITAKSDTRRLILMGALFIVLAAFALTYSRAGYVALMAGVGIFVLMTAPRLVPVALLVLILALPFIPAGIIERLFTLGQDTSSQYRFLIWGGVERMLGDFWVRGIGMGPAAFIRIYQGYAHPLAERAMHSHNTFLDILSHSGVGAFLAFLAYLFRLFKRGISAHLASTDKEFKIYVSAGIAALTVFVVFGAGEYVWFYPRVMLVFWAAAGLVAATADSMRSDSLR